MAFIDPESGVLTLRVVYDGAPGAGKTTNLRVLHETLFSARGGTLYSLGSVERRTEFFDWRALDGGYLDGRPFRVHVLSVPGQWSLRARRRILLRAADAVCFVSDASRGATVPQATMLASLLRADPRMADRLLVQVNKSDAPSALTAAEMRAALRVASSTPSIVAQAARNLGVSETFLQLTRLATSCFRSAAREGSSFAESMALTPQELHDEILALETLSWRSTEDASDENWSELDT